MSWGLYLDKCVITDGRTTHWPAGCDDRSDCGFADNFVCSCVLQVPHKFQLQQPGMQISKKTWQISISDIHSMHRVLTSSSSDDMIVESEDAALLRAGLPVSLDLGLSPCMVSTFHVD